MSDPEGVYVTVRTPPASPDVFADASWEDIAPWYEELAARRLDDAAAVERWLADWSRLEAMITEAASLAMIAYTIDTGDGAKEAAHLRFSTDILPKLEERSVALAKRLVESGYTRDGLDTTLPARVEAESLSTNTIG